MKTVNVEIKLYQFDELEEIDKEKVISDHRDFMLNTMSVNDYDGDEGAYRDERMHIVHHDAPVIEDIRARGYYYWNEMTGNVITYGGKHPRAGETVFMFQGKEYVI